MLFLEVLLLARLGLFLVARAVVIRVCLERVYYQRLRPTFLAWTDFGLFRVVAPVVIRTHLRRVLVHRTYPTFVAWTRLGGSMVI